MEILGLTEAISKILGAPRSPLKWGMEAVEKDKLRKPGIADPQKKAHRKMVEASRRRNR